MTGFYLPLALLSRRVLDEEKGSKVRIHHYPPPIGTSWLGGLRVDTDPEARTARTAVYQQLSWASFFLWSFSSCVGRPWLVPSISHLLLASFCHFAISQGFTHSYLSILSIEFFSFVMMFLISKNFYVLNVLFNITSYLFHGYDISCEDSIDFFSSYNFNSSKL